MKRFFTSVAAAAMMLTASAQFCFGGHRASGESGQDLLHAPGYGVLDQKDACRAECRAKEWQKKSYSYSSHKI